MTKLTSVAIMMILVSGVVVAGGTKWITSEDYIERLRQGRVDLAAHTNDVQALSSSKRFTIGGCGPGRYLTRPEAAFWRLYHRTNRVQLLSEVVETASPAGKAYCIFGLYYADEVQYETVARRHRASNDSFFRQSGCLASSNTLSQFIRLLENDVFNPIIEESKGPNPHKRAASKHKQP